MADVSFRSREDRIATAICDLFDAYDNSGCDDTAIVANVKAVANDRPDSLLCMCELRDLLSEAISEAIAEPVSEGSYSSALWGGIGVGLVIMLALYCAAMIYVKLF